MRRELIAESLGTFLLVFCGTSAIVVQQQMGSVTHVGVALTFGLVVLSLIYALGDVSGCHLNPAVTFGFFMARRLDGRKVLPYWGSQVLGALLASGMVRLLFPENVTIGATLPAGTDLQSFVLEVMLTFFLMFVILSVSTGSKEKGLLAGVAIGSVVALEALFAGPICGASMNPARSLGPAVVSGHLNSLWIYLLAPMIGAALSIVFCRCIQDSSCCSPSSQGTCA